MTLGPMTEATVKVSRAMPHIAAALEELVQGLCGEPVPWMLFAFTDGRASYVHNGLEDDTEAELMGHFRRYMSHMEMHARGEPVPHGWMPEPNKASRALARDIREVVENLAEVLDEIAGEHVLFAFLAFPQGVGQYASNAKREDVLKSLRDWLADKDAGMEDVPAHHFM